MERKHRIVVVEDNEVFALLMAEALGEDYDVVLGHNGLQGIALCLEAQTDLVLTDIGMPALDGLQMLKAFQKDPRLSHIPVIVVTASHFNSISRSEVKRFPQVRAMMSKTASVSSIIEEVSKALAGV